MADDQDRVELFNEPRAKGTAEEHEAHLDNRDLAVAQKIRKEEKL